MKNLMAVVVALVCVPSSVAFGQEGHQGHVVMTEREVPTPHRLGTIQVVVEQGAWGNEGFVPLLLDGLGQIGFDPIYTPGAGSWNPRLAWGQREEYGTDFVLFVNSVQWFGGNSSNGGFSVSPGQLFGHGGWNGWGNYRQGVLSSLQIGVSSQGQSLTVQIVAALTCTKGSRLIAGLEGRGSASYGGNGLSLSLNGLQMGGSSQGSANLPLQAAQVASMSLVRNLAARL